MRRPTPPTDRRQPTHTKQTPQHTTQSETSHAFFTAEALSHENEGRCLYHSVSLSRCTVGPMTISSGPLRHKRKTDIREGGGLHIYIYIGECAFYVCCVVVYLGPGSLMDLGGPMLCTVASAMPDPPLSHTHTHTHST